MRSSLEKIQKTKLEIPTASEQPVFPGAAIKKERKSRTKKGVEVPGAPEQSVAKLKRGIEKKSKTPELPVDLPYENSYDSMDPAQLGAELQKMVDNGEATLEIVAADSNFPADPFETVAMHPEEVLNSPTPPETVGSPAPTAAPGQNIDNIPKQPSSRQRDSLLEQTSPNQVKPKETLWDKLKNYILPDDEE